MATEMTQQPRTQPKEKRRWPLIVVAGMMILVIIVAAAACGNSSGATTTTAGNATTTAGSTATTAGSTVATGGSETTRATTALDKSLAAAEAKATTGKFGDTLTVQGADVTVSAPIKSDDQSLAGSGNVLYQVAVNLVNKGSAEVTFADLFWWAKASDGSHYIAATANETLGIKPGPVQPGSTIKGNMYFEIPSASSLASVSYKPAGTSASTWQQ
jgi:hypothetical protein